MGSLLSYKANEVLWIWCLISMGQSIDIVRKKTADSLTLTPCNQLMLNLKLGNCNICAEQKILFLRRWNGAKFSQYLKVEFKKSFKHYNQILLTVLIKVALKFCLFNMAQTKVSTMKWIFNKIFKSHLVKFSKNISAFYWINQNI